MPISFQQILMSHNRTIVDTCFILNKGFRPLVEGIVPTAISSGCQLCIPYSVLNELKKLSKDIFQPELRLKAIDMLSFIDKLVNRGIALYLGCESDNSHADSKILEYVTANRSDEHIAVLTQDKSLSSDLIMLNDMKSFLGRNVEVYKIDQTGKLSQFNGKEDNAMISNDKVTEAIWIDKEALLCIGLEKYILNNLFTLKAENKSICIQSAAERELSELAASDDPSAERASEVISILNKLKDRGYLIVLSNPTDPSDSAMQYLSGLIRYRSKYRITFIANNEDLSFDALMLNDLSSFNGNDISVHYLFENGKTAESFLINSAKDEQTLMSPRVQRDQLAKEIGLL